VASSWTLFFSYEADAQSNTHQKQNGNFVHVTQYILLQTYAEFLKLRSQILHVLIQAESYNFLVVLDVDAAVF